MVKNLSMTRTSGASNFKSRSGFIAANAIAATMPPTIRIAMIPRAIHPAFNPPAIPKIAKPMTMITKKPALIDT